MDIHLGLLTAPTSRGAIRVRSPVEQVLGCDAATHNGITPSPNRTYASERARHAAQEDGPCLADNLQI